MTRDKLDICIKATKRFVKPFVASGHTFGLVRVLYSHTVWRCVTSSSFVNKQKSKMHPQLHCMDAANKQLSKDDAIANTVLSRVT